MSTQARIYTACQELGDCVILHPSFKDARDGICQLVQQAEFSGLPFGATVIGESGSGKTTLMRAIVKQMPSQDLLGERPSALCISAQSCPTIGDLLAKMARELGFPVVVRGNRLSDMSVHLISALKDRAVRAIFIQDFQHLYRGARDKSAAGITDWLKQLAEDAGIVVVLFATPELGDLSHLNLQLHTRAPARFRLSPFPRDENWIAFLKGVAGRCSALDWSPIYEKYERDLHVVTQGLARPLKQLLSAAATCVLSVDGTKLSADVFSQAHRLVFGTDSSVPNPFQGRVK